jgi:predicted transcriptional regulator
MGTHKNKNNTVPHLVPIKILSSLPNYSISEGALLIEQQVKILKLMSEITSRIDLNEFAKKVGLTSTEILVQMQELARQGYLRRAGGGFTITDKGKDALKPYRNVASEKQFQFYMALDQPTGLSVGSIAEFCEVTAKVDVASLEFHLSRGDFENWFQDAAQEPVFAAELVKIKASNLTGEDLRNAILKAATTRYSL